MGRHPNGADVDAALVGAAGIVKEHQPIARTMNNADKRNDLVLFIEMIDEQIAPFDQKVVIWRYLRDCSPASRVVSKATESLRDSMNDLIRGARTLFGDIGPNIL